MKSLSVLLTPPDISCNHDYLFTLEFSCILDFRTLRRFAVETGQETLYCCWCLERCLWDDTGKSRYNSYVCKENILITLHQSCINIHRRNNHHDGSRFHTESKTTNSGCLTINTTTPTAHGYWYARCIQQQRQKKHIMLVHCCIVKWENLQSI